MTDKDNFEIFDTIAKKGQDNIFRYFDRIHDKLFTFNNILIAGYYAISKLELNVPITRIIIPFSNLALLIFIEYRLMELSRHESNINDKTLPEIKSMKIKYSSLTWLSLISIVSTTAVALIFLFSIL